MVAAFQSALRENADRVMQVTSAADLDAVEAGDGIGLLLSLEGVECFGVETWPADVFHALGVRMAGLTWNRRNAFADGAAEEGGSLSRLGRRAGRPPRLARRDPRPRPRLARRLRGGARAGRLRRRARALLARRLPRRVRHAAEPRRRPAARACRRERDLRAHAAPRRDRARAADDRRRDRPPRARGLGDRDRARLPRRRLHEAVVGGDAASPGAEGRPGAARCDTGPGNRGSARAPSSTPRSWRSSASAAGARRRSPR